MEQCGPENIRSAATRYVFFSMIQHLDDLSAILSGTPLSESQFSALPVLVPT